MKDIPTAHAEWLWLKTEEKKLKRKLLLVHILQALAILLMFVLQYILIVAYHWNGDYVFIWCCISLVLVMKGSDSYTWGTRFQLRHVQQNLRMCKQ